MIAKTKKLQIIACVVMAFICLGSLSCVIYNYYSLRYKIIGIDGIYGCMKYSQTSPDSRYTVEIHEYALFDEYAVYCFDNFSDRDSNKLYCTLYLTDLDSDDVIIVWNDNDAVIKIEYWYRVGFHHLEYENYSITIPYEDFE